MPPRSVGDATKFRPPRSAVAALLRPRRDYRAQRARKPIAQPATLLRRGGSTSGHKKTQPRSRERGCVEDDPALTYFRAKHYHRPWLLDCRVRKGNGYFQPGMGTGRRLLEPSPEPHLASAHLHRSVASRNSGKPNRTATDVRGRLASRGRRPHRAACRRQLLWFAPNRNAEQRGNIGLVERDRGGPRLTICPASDRPLTGLHRMGLATAWKKI